MKKTIMILPIFFMAFFDIQTCFAQSWEKQSVMISGRITGRATIHDSLVVYLYKNYNLYGVSHFNVPLDSGGRFSFSLEPIDHPASLQIGLQGYSRILINKFIEPGDSAILEVDVFKAIPKISYSGKFSANYECQDTLNTVYEEFLDSLNSKQEKLKKVALSDPKYYYQQRHRINLYMYYKMLDVLDRYSSRISATMRQFLSGTSTYQALGQWDLQIKFDYSRAINEENKQQINDIYSRYKFPNYYMDQTIISNNPTYIGYLLGKSKTELYLKNKGMGYSYISLYQQLKGDYGGKVRDKVITQFLYDPSSSLEVVDFSMDDYEYCLNDAYSLLTDSFLKQKVKEKFKLKSGSSAFNFTLVDSTGKAVRLKDLKGKVVLLDLWFTGCSGCASFSKMFHEHVYPKIKNRKRFAVVSVNIDQRKKTWMQGIKSGKYTQESYINLTTGGQEHPLIRYYNIVAYPFILLIGKDGNVYSKIDQGLGSTEVLSLISNALSQ